MSDSRLATLTGHLQAWAALYAAAGQVALSVLVLSQHVWFSFIEAPYLVVAGGWLLAVIAIHYPWQTRTSLSDARGRPLLYRNLSRRSRLGLTAAATLSSLIAIAGLRYVEGRPGTAAPLPPPFSSSKAWPSPRV